MGEGLFTLMLLALSLISLCIGDVFPFCLYLWPQEALVARYFITCLVGVLPFDISFFLDDLWFRELYSSINCSLLGPRFVDLPFDICPRSFFSWILCVCTVCCRSFKSPRIAYSIGITLLYPYAYLDVVRSSWSSLIPLPLDIGVWFSTRWVGRPGILSC